MAKRMGMGNDTDPNGNADGLSPLDDGFFDDDAGLVDDEDAGEDYDDDEYDDSDADDADGEEGDDDEGSDRKYAGMYNSVEELEKAYKSLQTAYQQTKKSLVERISEVSGRNSQIPQNTQQLPQLDPNLIAQAMAEDPVETTRLLMAYGAQMGQQQSQPQKGNDIALKLEIMECREKHRDFDMYGDAIADIIEKNPSILEMQNGMEVAYKLAKAENPQRIVDKALQAGRRQGYESAKGKSKVSATNGGKGSQTRRSQPKSAADNAVDDMMAIVKGRGGFGL